MSDNERLINLLREGRITDFNETRPTKLDFFGADLAELDLSGVDFAQASLAKADLSGAKLLGARLDGVNLDGADLSSVSMGDLYIQDASFKDAALDDLQASGTFLSCDFSGSSWSGTGTRGCRFIRCNFEDAEFASSYFKRHNQFSECTPESLFEEEKPAKPPQIPEPNFLAPKAPARTGEKVEVSSYQIEFSREMVEELFRFLTREGKGEEIASGRLALRPFGERLYLGIAPKGEKGPLTDWIRFDLVRGTFYRSTEVKSANPKFIREVALPLAVRFRGDVEVTFRKKDEAETLRLEDGQKVDPNLVLPSLAARLRGRPSLRLVGSEEEEDPENFLPFEED